jgi:hypothetical protein
MIRAGSVSEKIQSRGRCYGHNFLRFFTISSKKLAFVSRTNVMIKILHNLALFSVKNATFFLRIFWRKYFKNHKICPRTCFIEWTLLKRFNWFRTKKIFAWCNWH